MAAALDIITDALQEIGAIGAGETPNSNDAALGLSRLNLMLGGWSLQPGTIPVTARETFTLTANKGGPDNPYTIGPGGDFDTARPNSIYAVAVLQNPGTASEVEIPRALFTVDAYAVNQVKQLTNVFFTDCYYIPSFSGGLGTIILWPIPTSTAYKIVLYLRKQLSTFADLATNYDLPPGCQEALLYNLAVRLCKPFGRPVDPETLRMARQSLAIFKRGNLQISDMPTDIAITSNSRYGYNIRTGTGS
jgi:hypothetical protein